MTPEYRSLVSGIVWVLEEERIVQSVRHSGWGVGLGARLKGLLTRRSLQMTDGRLLHGQLFRPPSTSRSVLILTYRVCQGILKFRG